MRWRIFLNGDKPLTVELPEERNLADEFVEFHAATQRPWWKVWTPRPNPYWRVTDEITIHRDIVLGIANRPDRPDRQSIGFGGIHGQSL